jgi:hypothetical protein
MFEVKWTGRLCGVWRLQRCLPGIGPFVSCSGGHSLNNFVLIVLDSLRFDSFQLAAPRAMQRLGTVEQRWSYASWTAPSHYNLLMGLMPHSSPTNIFASEYYKKDFLRFNERLGNSDIAFKSLVPSLFLPLFLKSTLGYATHARVSMPVLNPRTPLNFGFDTFRLMEKHNDMRTMIREVTFSEERPSFWLLNVGETHYPYALPSESVSEWPSLHGVHGVFKHLDECIVGGKLVPGRDLPDFDARKMKELHSRQIEAVRYLDGVVEELFEMVPRNTYITITSDHGELFGEDGFFGHGPIAHSKVMEVPFVEGKLR